MAHISKNILAVLLAVTIVISVVGTWVTFMIMSGQFKVPVSPGEPVASGKVGVTVLSDIPPVPAEPMETDGMVAVIIK
jgi:hypothetical protein